MSSNIGYYPAIVSLMFGTLLLCFGFFDSKDDRAWRTILLVSGALALELGGVLTYYIHLLHVGIATGSPVAFYLIYAASTVTAGMGWLFFFGSIWKVGRKRKAFFIIAILCLNTAAACALFAKDIQGRQSPTAVSP